MSTPAQDKQRNQAIGCLGLLAILGIAAITGFGRNSATPTGEPAPAPTQAPPAAPVTLLDLPGNGIKNSSAFTTTGPWTIAYSYDCTGFAGGTGNFAIYVEDDSGAPVSVPVNELGAKGTDTSAVYNTGHLHLSMNSECPWHVRATQP